METNVRHEGSKSIFSLEFSIEEKHADVEFTDEIDYSILEQHRVVLTKALKARMKQCIELLYQNRDSVLISDKNGILFKRCGKYYHNFNFTSYEVMKNTLVYIDQSIWSKVVTNKLAVLQLLKALYLLDKSEYSDMLIDCLFAYL